jgi:hypothetical protein
VQPAKYAKAKYLWPEAVLRTSSLLCHLSEYRTFDKKLVLVYWQSSTPTDEKFQRIVAGNPLSVGTLHPLTNWPFHFGCGFAAQSNVQRRGASERQDNSKRN